MIVREWSCGCEVVIWTEELDHVAEEFPCDEAKNILKEENEQWNEFFLTDSPEAEKSALAAHRRLQEHHTVNGPVLEEVRP